MKFKTIFFLFNGIILFSFLFIALMPLFVLGGEYTMIFWSENWFLAVIFLLFISVLDGYFIINWKMFSLLEKEDWPGLTAYLEQEIYEKGRISRKNVKMMINTSLTISNLDKIIRLEKEIREKKPSRLAVYGVSLGIPYLLNQNLDEGKKFFTECMNLSDKKDNPWLSWCYSFLLLSGQELEEAEPHLKDLSSRKKDPVLQLLSLYLYNTTVPHSGSEEFMAETRDDFTGRFPSAKSLEKEISKSKSSNITVMLLSSILEDSLNWLYSNNQ